MVSRLLLGVAVAAATFVVLGFGQSGGHPAAAHSRPLTTDLYARAMFKLGEGTSTVTEQHGVLVAMMRFVSPPDIPQISVDAAIAASRVQQACRCRLRGYQIVTDRFGPDVIGVAGGVPQHVNDPKGYTAQVWVMDGDSNAYIARRAAQLVKEVRSAPGARVSIKITRGQQTVFSYALRPATGDSMAWALTGIRLPPGLSRDEHPPSPGGSPTAAARAPLVGVLAG
jgi:hypothetical protein